MSTRKSAFDFFFFKILSGSKMLLFQELRCVTTLIPWLSFNGFVSSNVRYVTCSHGTDCHAESPSGRVQRFKMAKIDPVSPFYPTLWLEKEILQREKLQEVQKNEPLGCKYLLLCVSKLEVFTQLPPAYHWMKIPELWWCLTEISFKNPGQFPGMF